MRKLFFKLFTALNVSLLLLAIPGFGQDEKPEKVLVGIGVQYKLPAKYFNNDINKFDNRNAGAGFYIEPKLLKKKLLFALKAEYAMVQENFKTDAIRSYSLVSLSPGIKYLFLERKNTPYVGFGTGLYYISLVEQNFNWGIEPNAGYIFKKVQLSLNYNRILNKLESKAGGFNNYYLALKIGVEL